MYDYNLPISNRTAARSVSARIALRSDHGDVISVLVCALFLSLLGCGGSDQLARAPVTGKVTLDGEPVTEATILFRPDAGRAGQGKIKDGVIVEASTYGINDGIVLGTHQIAVQPIPDDPPPAPSRVQGEDSTLSPPLALGPRPTKAKTDIPAKYQDVDRSGLTVEIKDGENELNIELTRE